MTTKDIRDILYRRNSFDTFESFLHMLPALHKRNYWSALRIAHDCSDNLFQYRYHKLAAFLSDEPEREYLMNKGERRILATMPQTVEIFRAMTEVEYETGIFGVSWTLDKSVAKYFQREYQRNYDTRLHDKMIHSISIDRDNILAFMNERQEQEIITLVNVPEKIKKSRYAYLLPKNSNDWFEISRWEEHLLLLEVES